MTAMSSTCFPKNNQQVVLLRVQLSMQSTLIANCILETLWQVFTLNLDQDQARVHCHCRLYHTKPNFASFSAFELAQLVEHTTSLLQHGPSAFMVPDLLAPEPNVGLPDCCSCCNCLARYGLELNATLFGLLGLPYIAP